MTWEEILPALIGAGIGTAIVEAGTTLYQYFKTGRNQASFLAFRVVIQMESYAAQCISRLFDVDNWDSSRGAMGHIWVLLPDFPEFPEDPDGWRNVGTDVMHLAYTLRSDHEAVQSSQFFLSDEVGGEEALESFPPVCWKMAHQALLVARNIRLRYGFPEGAAGTWGHVEGLRWKFEVKD
ncbi:hypothetical protein [Rhizobium sp. AAP43]|uniref:hypothetical protein n=1 Tax=Rhizobium sp. AAP43 TaxID=1523420 RepID=UPI0006B91D38|nr:hypothetical protein [Rhizobium sp. AAP43]KPF42092.1 hypothetical protein IP76_18505 [Rhizobium sp. AAP43]